MIVSMEVNGGDFVIVEKNYDDGTVYSIEFYDLGGAKFFGEYKKLGDAFREFGELFESITDGRY